MSKTALVSGATGQDGSYLIELLLEKGYSVSALDRRKSVPNNQNIAHVGDKIKMEMGDINDAASVCRLVAQGFDEIYHLAAQSDVSISFTQPFFTFTNNSVSTLSFLENIRVHSPKTKFYFAGTSEMYGGLQKEPYSEKSPFHPRSPYGVSKLAAYWLVRNYREAYGLKCCSGILFNHETLTEDTPLIYRHGNEGSINIAPIGEIVCEHTIITKDRQEYQQTDSIDSGLQVWDKDRWTKVTCASGYPHNIEDDNKHPMIINARCGSYTATNNHVCIMEDNTEKETKDIVIGDKVSVTSFEHITSSNPSAVTIAEAKVIGLLVADGYISPDLHTIRLTNKSDFVKNMFRDLWLEIGVSGFYEYPSKSGFTGEIIGQVNVQGVDKARLSPLLDIYTQDRKKKVPKPILNSSTSVMRAFLEGYNIGDGLRSNPCICEFRNFKTNSQSLALGLVFLIQKTTDQEVNITVEESDTWTDQDINYSINLLSDSAAGQNHRNSIQKYHIVSDMLSQKVPMRQISRETSISRTFIKNVSRGYVPSGLHHFSKPRNEVKKTISLDGYNGWFFDLETESGTFSAGSGLCHVHNSPRRGGNFVTKKICDWIRDLQSYLGCSYGQYENYEQFLKQVDSHAKKKGSLRLGNLEARRDWGYAPDFTEGMWRILNQNEIKGKSEDRPMEDYVLGTGTARSVREFVEIAFKEALDVKITWKKTGDTSSTEGGAKKYQKECGYIDNSDVCIIEMAEEFYRPSEVNILIADPTKAQKELGWMPRHSFNDLVIKMLGMDPSKEYNRNRKFPKSPRK